MGCPRRRVGGVSAKVLTDVLRSLERDGLVSRHVFATVPMRVDYKLTPLGRSLLKCLDGLREWAQGHMRRVAEARAVFDRRKPAGEVEA